MSGNKNSKKEVPLKIGGLKSKGQDAYKSGAVMGHQNQGQQSLFGDNQPVRIKGQPVSVNMSFQQHQQTRQMQMKGQPVLIQVQKQQPVMMAPVASKLGKGQNLIFVPSKVAMKGLQPSPEAMNPLTRVNVPHLNADEAMKKMTCSLRNALFDVEFSVNKANYTAEGTAFIRGELPSRFRVTVYASETQGSVLCFTRQSSCTAIAFAELFAWFQHSMLNTNTNTNISSCSSGSGSGSGSGTSESKSNSNMSSLPPLSPFSTTLPDLPMDLFSDSSFTSMGQEEELLGGYSQSDLDLLAQDIDDDAFQVETLSIVYSLEAELINSHQNLVKAIVGAVRSQDMAAQRLALKICQKIGKKIRGLNIQSQSSIIQNLVEKVSVSQ